MFQSYRTITRLHVFQTTGKKVKYKYHKYISCETPLTYFLQLLILFKFFLGSLNCVTSVFDSFLFQMF